MSIINMEYLKREMALNDETIKELRFIKPELTLLIENNLIEIDSLSKSLELIDNYCLCDVFDEINSFLIKNGEYIILYKNELVQDLSFYIRKENQEKIKKLKEIKNLSEDKDLVKEMIKEYDF